jgi:hypothetical protein
MLAENRFCNGKRSGDIVYLRRITRKWSGSHRKRDLLVAVFPFCEVARNL